MVVDDAGVEGARDGARALTEESGGLGFDGVLDVRGTRGRVVVVGLVADEILEMFRPDASGAGGNVILLIEVEASLSSESALPGWPG